MDKLTQFQPVVDEAKADLQHQKKDALKKLTTEIKKLGSDDEILKWINGFNEMIEAEAKNLLARSKLSKIYLPRMIEHIVKKNHAVKYGELWVQSVFGQVPKITTQLLKNHNEKLQP